MKKTVTNTAIALLLSLGVAACGSRHKETIVSTTPNTSAAELSIVKQQLADAQRALATAETAAAEAKEAQTTVENTLQAAQIEAETAKSTAAAAQTQLAAAQQEIENLKARLANSSDSTEVEALKAALAAAEQKAAQAETELVSANSALEKANSELAATESQLANYVAKEKVAGDKIVSDLTAGGFAADSTSYTYAYLNDEVKKAELAEVIANGTASCGSAASPVTGAAVAGCLRLSNTAAGTILFTKENEYSAYAVVREAYDADSGVNTPKNSFIAMVKTPTTDKAQVLGATYRGLATYSQSAGLSGSSLVGENIAAAAGKLNVVTLNVDQNGQISGEIWNKTSAKEENHYRTVELKAADVLVSNSGVVFEGDAAINEKMLKTGTPLEGTYKGAFAGNEGQEVVGTFQTNSLETNYVQGAFSATKDSAE
ncbi:hypothetical protein V5G99_01160 [Bibersteinia trehalosi]|uniref:hypothetical protein n=1 Tax=Bibersteinia trehalosi TaxID=47735 RepID=UPI003D275712